MQKDKKLVCSEALLNNFEKIENKLNHFKGEVYWVSNESFH